MSRPKESQLYRELIDSRFRFIERGTREINEIYDSVKREYSDLCDDEYKCDHYKSAGLNQPECKHVVRNALQHCKNDDIAFSVNMGYWIFSYFRNNHFLVLVQNS